MSTTSTEITHVTDDTFAAEVEGSTGKVLVDFWATWCGPCHMLSPILEQIAKERAGTLRVVKLNADENPRTTARFGVRGLPTMILFENGKPAKQIVGAVPKGKIEQALDS